MNKSEFMRWFNETHHKCFYCDLPEWKLKELKHGRCQGRNNLEIDRVDISRGYLIDNIVFSCPLCNMVKADVFNKREMREIGQKYIKPKWRNL